MIFNLEIESSSRERIFFSQPLHENEFIYIYIVISRIKVIKRKRHKKMKNLSLECGWNYKVLIMDFGSNVSPLQHKNNHRQANTWSAKIKLRQTMYQI